MDQRDVVTFTEAILQVSGHVCAFFHDRDEEYDVLLPFIAEGIEQGDKAFHILDPELLSDHLARLEKAGIDLNAAAARGQLEVRSWHDVHLRRGHFDQDAVLSFVEAALRDGKGQGFRLTRLLGHMEWALEDRPGVRNLVEYEARLNDVLRGYDDPVICVYDLAKFGAALAIDVLRTHPMVIIGGLIQRNSFFMPPDEFLRNSRQRRVRDGQV